MGWEGLWRRELLLPGCTWGREISPPKQTHFGKRYFLPSPLAAGSRALLTRMQGTESLSPSSYRPARRVAGLSAQTHPHTLPNTTFLPYTWKEFVRGLGGELKMQGSWLSHPQLWEQSGEGHRNQDSWVLFRGLMVRADGGGGGNQDSWILFLDLAEREGSLLVRIKNSVRMALVRACRFL